MNLLLQSPNINRGNFGNLLDVVFTDVNEGEIVARGASNWVNKTLAEAGISAVGHTHDDRYYTESEVDSLLSGYSVVGHDHDDRYYTETEIDNALLGYAFLAGRSGGQTLYGGTDSGDDLTLQSTAHATKGNIYLGDYFWIAAPNLSAYGYNGCLRWHGGSKLIEQDASTGQSTNRMLYQPNGDRFEVLNKAGTKFIVGFHGNDSALKNRIIFYHPLGVANYTAGVSPERTLHVKTKDAVTNTVTYTQRLDHITSNTVVTGFGTGLEFVLQENDGTSRVAGILECLWTDAGETVSCDADLVAKLMQNDGAAAEVWRAVSNGDFKIQNDYYAQGNQGLSGTMTLDDGANWRITLTFVGGILTGQTTGVSSGATAAWA